MQNHYMVDGSDKLDYGLIPWIYMKMHTLFNKMRLGEPIGMVNRVAAKDLINTHGLVYILESLC